MRTSFVPIKKSVDYSKFFGKYNSKRCVCFRVSYYVGKSVTRVCQHTVTGRKTNTETHVYVGSIHSIHFIWRPLGRKHINS